MNTNTICQSRRRDVGQRNGKLADGFYQVEVVGRKPFSGCSRMKDDVPEPLFKQALHLLFLYLVDGFIID